MKLYVGIDEPFKGSVPVPIPFFNAFLPSGYFADSTLSGFHLVIATLVASCYVIFLVSHPINRINKSLFKAVLTFHKPHFLTRCDLRVVFSDFPMSCDLLTRPTLKGMDFVNHFLKTHFPSDPILIHFALHWKFLSLYEQTQPRYSLPSLTPCLRIIGP